jgi:hypothetical protein
MRTAWTLLKRKMGFRSLLEVTPLDPGLVKLKNVPPQLSAPGNPSGDFFKYIDY